MPITLTFDIVTDSVGDTNDRTRITACFRRLGWEHIGGSAWRYPALGTENTSEDWFNHVIPALMFFRSIASHGGFEVHQFTIDAHSEAGHRGRATPPLGEPIEDAANITMYPCEGTTGDALSEARLRRFIQGAADNFEPS